VLIAVPPYGSSALRFKESNSANTTLIFVPRDRIT